MSSKSCLTVTKKSQEICVNVRRFLWYVDVISFFVWTQTSKPQCQNLVSANNYVTLDNSPNFLSVSHKKKPSYLKIVQPICQPAHLYDFHLPIIDIKLILSRQEILLFICLTKLSKWPHSARNSVKWWEYSQRWIISA